MEGIASLTNHDRAEVKSIATRFFLKYTNKIITLNFDKMMTLKKKRSYEDPLTTVTQADLEGLICSSVLYLMEVDELHNMNADPEVQDDVNFYFEL